MSSPYSSQIAPKYPESGYPGPIQAAFETLERCHETLMRIKTPADFLEQSETIWHQREHAIRTLSRFIASEKPLTETLHEQLAHRLDTLEQDDKRLQQYIEQFRDVLQGQRRVNRHQRQAIQQYGR